jgi:hypothetical protein
MSTDIDEALTFIAQHPHVYLLARRRDGYPTGYAMTAKVHDGAVEFSTYRASAKVTNLLRDGVAGILAAAEAPGDARVVLVHGSVSVTAGSWFGQPEPARPGPDGPRWLVPNEITDAVAARHQSGKRCVLRVTIESARFSTAASS